MTERPKVHDWKSCVPVRVPRVQIPLSPLVLVGIMRIPKIYLETTIFNFPFADDAVNYQSDTLKLFEEIKAGKFAPFTSEYVILELDRTKDIGKLEQMKALIAGYGVKVIPMNENTEQLANIYVKEGVIPLKYKTDALHIAVASVAGLDCVVSLNFKHIVKRKTTIETGIINIREGYSRVFIYTPMEVTDYAEIA